MAPGFPCHGFLLSIPDCADYLVSPEGMPIDLTPSANIICTIYTYVKVGHFYQKSIPIIDAIHGESGSFWAASKCHKNGPLSPTLLSNTGLFTPNRPRKFEVKCTGFRSGGPSLGSGRRGWQGGCQAGPGIDPWGSSDHFLSFTPTLTLGYPSRDTNTKSMVASCGDLF